MSKILNMRKKIFVDMDGVLCDFYGAAKKALMENPTQKYPQSKWGFFLKLQEMPDSVESVKELNKVYDVWILTRPSSRNVNCYTEKAQWIWDHLGYEFLEKTIFSGDKSLIMGDYLIDDQNNANQDKFVGEWIHFGSDKFPDWKSVKKYLL
jgi:5'-nucleotidase